MNKKFLSAFGVIIIFTFCSVKAGRMEKFKRAVKSVGKGVKTSVSSALDIKGKVSTSAKGLTTGAQELKTGIGAKIQESKEALKSSKETLTGAGQEAPRHSTEEAFGVEKAALDVQAQALAQAHAQREAAVTAQKGVEAQRKAALEAADEARKKAPPPPPMPGETPRKDIISPDQIKDGVYTTASGQKIEVKPGQKFVLVDGKYLRIGEPPKKEPLSVIEEKRGFVDKLKSKVGNFFAGTPKTLEEQIKRQQVKMLFNRQQKNKGEEPDSDKSPMDAVFLKMGLKVSQAFPDTSMKFMRQSLKMHDTALHRWAKGKNDDAKNIHEKIKKMLHMSGKKFAEDADVDEAIRKRFEEALAQFHAEMEQEKQQRAAEKMPELTEKEITDRQKDFEDTFKSKDFREQVRRELDEEILKEKAIADLNELQQKNPEKYRKKMEAIAKDMGLKSSLVQKFLNPKEYGEKMEGLKKILENPQTETERKQRDAINKALLDDTKEDLKKTFVEKSRDFTQKMREQTQSMTAMVLAMISSVIITKIISAIQNRVVGDINKQAKEEGEQRRSKKEDLDYKYAKLKKERVRLATKAEQEQAGVAKRAVEAKSAEEQEQEILLDATAKVSNFLLTFDDFFCEILGKFGYNDKVLNATSRLSYSGGTVGAGIALLFNYTGAGNIANGLTPVNTKVYPTYVRGNALSFDSVVESVDNALSYELITVLSKGYPEPIFLIKAISLFNTANKQFEDVEQRNEFLEDELNKLFFRLMWTVDERSTFQANVFEPDQDKWENVYFKDISKCLLNAPDALRNMMKNLVVKGVKDDGGNIIDVSYEQFIIDKFDDFKIMKVVPFEGDVNFNYESQQFDPKEIEIAVFIVMMRALNDVLKLEKELAQKTEPAKMRNMQGKEETIVGKDLYNQLTQVAFGKLNKAQDAYIESVIELGFDPENSELQKTCQTNEKAFIAAAAAYDVAALSFRKKVSSYVFDRTQGLEPETVLDFVKRELKRFYLSATDKKAFDTGFAKIFATFAPNFPFTVQDILKYVKDPSPITHPKPRFIEQEIVDIAQTPEPAVAAE